MKEIKETNFMKKLNMKNYTIIKSIKDDFFSKKDVVYNGKTYTKKIKSTY